MTLIYTTPAFADAAEHGLPGPQQHILDAMAEAAFEPAPTTDEERIERRVTDTQLYVGTRYPYDAEWVRREARDEVAHAPYAEPAHGVAVMRSDSLVPALGSLRQPALVLHGTADPIIDVAHGRFLAERLPNGSYIEYDGLGHEMPPAFCREIVDPRSGSDHRHVTPGPERGRQVPAFFFVGSGASGCRGSVPRRPECRKLFDTDLDGDIGVPPGKEPEAV